MSLKFCANLNFLFTENGGLLDRFRAASLAGFKAVENGFPHDISVGDALSIQKETGLEVALLNICLGKVAGGEFGCTALPGKDIEFRENFALTLQYAKALNCRKIHLMAGRISDGLIEQTHHDTYEKNLHYAARILETENIIGVIEPISSYGVPGYYLNSYDRAIEVIKKIDSPNIKLMIDFYHLQHLRGNVTNSLKDLNLLIGHVQIAQVPRRNEPNSSGELNFNYIFKILKEIGYNDWIGCEYKPLNGSTLDGLSWLKEYKQNL